MSLYESEDSNDENYINRYLSIKPKKKINREIFNKPYLKKNNQYISNENDINSFKTRNTESDNSRNEMSNNELTLNESIIKSQESKCISYVSKKTLTNTKNKFSIKNYEEKNENSEDYMDICEDEEEKMDSISLNINDKKNCFIFYENKEINKVKIFNKIFLPCREEEQKEIYNYIKNGLKTNGNYNPLYICGTTGTGKTESVKRIINLMTEENKENIEAPFRYLFLNAVYFDTNIKLIKSIYNFIFSKKGPETKVSKYLNMLDLFFSRRNKFNGNIYLNDPTNSHIILIIDEIDYLLNKFQIMLYHIFNWSTYQNSKLIIISISNLIYINELMSSKIVSRFGQNKILFKPYNKEQIREIINYKGINLNLFDEDALRLVSMKVAAINGDLRRVIIILRHALEIYNNDIKKNQNYNLINKFYIIKSCQDLFGNKIINIMKSLNIFEKIIIASILFNIIKNKNNFVKVENMYDTLDIILKKYNELNINNESFELDINWDEFKNIVYNLKRLNIIELRVNNNIDNFKDNLIVIKFFADEFSIACESDEDLKKLINFFN